MRNQSKEMIKNIVDTRKPDDKKMVEALNV